LNTRQAEIVSTVLYVEKTMNKGGMSEKEVLEEVMKWKQERRPPLEIKEVAETIRNLGVLKWYKLDFSKDLPVEED